MTKLNLLVTGMTCGHCEKAIKQAIKSVDTNAAIEIKRTENLVIVDTAEAAETIVAAITAEGYPASQGS